jgi:Lrp/AsnC family transcriptional regulator, leucine-responsive regulatory protein
MAGNVDKLTVGPLKDRGLARTQAQMPGAGGRSNRARSDPARPIQLDPSDYRLLAALRDDARAPVSELARQSHLSRATAYQRLARLESAGVITGYSANVSSRRVGLGLTALIHISLRQTDWRQLIDQVRDIPEVEYLGMTTGSFDALMIVRTKDMDALRDGVLYRVLQLPFVRSTQTAFVLDEVVHRPYVLPPAANR